MIPLQLSSFMIVADENFLTLDIPLGLIVPDTLLVKMMYNLANINNHIHAYLNIVDMNFFLLDSTEKHKYFVAKPLQGV